MYRKPVSKSVLPCTAALSVTAMLMSATAQAVTLPTTGIYDENVTQTNTVDQITTPDPDQNLTSVEFTALVASAFAANRGGVINFDSVTAPTTIIASGSTGRNFSATYGISQADTLTFTDTSTFTGPLLVQTGVTTPISGPNFLSTSAGFSFRLAFSDPLLAFGITVLDREATTGNRTLNLTFTLQDSSTVSISDAVGAGGAPGEANDDTFFGYRATPGNGIVSANFAASNFQRYDDLGFIVIPEPASLALVGLGGLLMLGRTRRV